MFADFDTSVKRIIAQPFLLSAQVEATVRRHVPDFLLLADTEPTVVDVKPRLQLSKTKVSFTLARPPELPPHRQHFADRRNASS